MKKYFSTIIFSFLTFVFLISAYTGKAQLVVSNSMSNIQLAQSIVGPGITVSNVVVNCHPDAYGSFDGTNSNIGLSSGLVLTSGLLNYAPGPNNEDGEFYTDLYWPGNALLSAASNTTTFDACVFEFDMIPVGDTIRFNFVFGSEEYMDWVGSIFVVNDVFGFFISGPDPQGGNYVNKNLAVIPGTNISVSIDNVNANSYPQYYFDNENPPGQTVEYDGFTRDLQAVSPVIPCQTYHLTLAIADGGDGVLDSGVFLEEISSNSVDVSATTQGGIDNAIEGCNNGSITFTRTEVDGNPYSVNFTLGGTATNGEDYDTISTSVTIPANQASVTIDIITTNDGIPEGDETIEVYLYNSCSNIPYDTAEIIIKEQLDVEIADDTISICPGGNTPLLATGAATYQWSPTTGLSNPNIANPTASPFSTTEYTVTGTLAGCTNTDVVVVQVLNNIPPTISPSTTICEGDSTQLLGTGSATYSWSPAGSLSDPNIANPIATPTTTTVYTLTVDACGNGTQTLNTTVTVIPQPNVSFSGLDTAYCESANSANLTGSPAGGTFSGPGINSNSFDPMLAGDGTHTITYSYTDNNGCGGTTDKVVRVDPMPAVSFSGLAPAYCEDDNSQVALTPVPTGGVFSGNGVSGNQFSPSAAGPGTHTIFYTYTDPNPPGCAGITSQEVTVQSTPQPKLVLSDDPSFCEGGAISISTDEAYTTYQWSDGSTADFIDVNTEGTFFVQVTTSAGCVGYSDTVSTEVFPVPTITAEPDTMILAGNSVEVITSVNIGGTTVYTWSPTVALNCLDCPIVTATPLHTTEYSVTAEVDGCESDPATVLIEVTEGDLYIPNAFSPNGDGHNDYFRPIIENPNMELEEFKVFNRWGEMVYDGAGFWDGYYKGGAAPIDTYVYYAVIKTAAGESIEKQGNVTLIR